jgi:hypothetical protein
MSKREPLKTARLRLALGMSRPRARIVPRASIEPTGPSLGSQIYALVAARRDKSLAPELRRSDVDCDALVAALRRGQPLPPAIGPR